MPEQDSDNAGAGPGAPPDEASSATLASLQRDVSRLRAAAGGAAGDDAVYASLGAALWPYAPELAAGFARRESSVEARDLARPRLLAELAHAWLDAVAQGGVASARVQGAARRAERVERLFASRGLAVAALLRLGAAVEDTVSGWEKVPAARRREWIAAWRSSLHVEASLLADSAGAAGPPRLAEPAEPMGRGGRASSDLARLQGQLAYAGERLRALGELIDYPSVAFDEGRRVLWANAPAEQLFAGLGRDLVGVSMQELVREGDFPEEDYLRARGLIDGRETGRAPAQALHVRRGGGEETLVEATLTAWRVGLGRGAETTYTVVLRDLSEPARIAEGLRRSEAGYRALIEHSPDGVLVVLDDRVVYTNPAFLRLVDRTREEVLAVPNFAELVHPEERATVARYQAYAMAGNRTPRHRPIRVVRPDGTIRHAEVVALPFVYDGRASLLCVVRDVTERLQLQARVMRADRLLTVGTLARGLTHEINNPLTYVMTNVDFALREVHSLPGLADDARGELADALTEALAGADRVRNIATALRTFTGDDEAPPAPVDVARVVQGAVGVVSGMARRRARVEIEEAPVPPVRGNEARLGQVFLALLVNALQAVPEGEDGHSVRVRLSARGGRVVVAVRDTGVGIPPAILPRIFDPFFTTRPLGVGTGLGLSTALASVHAMGGEIEVESTPGEGSEFRVVLPALEG